jgi:predicted PurR-regulated permease PerM
MVILAVLAMGDLLGFAGVILAVPIAAVITVLLDELYVKPLGVVPSPRAAELPEREEPTSAPHS